MGFKKRPPTPLLHTVDSIDWSQIETAYGPADEVPAALRTLTNADPHERAHAFKWLDNRVNHQGWASPAAEAVIPFLLELAGDPQVGDRARIIELIGNLAVGGTHTEFLSGDYGDVDGELVARIRATVSAARARLVAGLTDADAPTRAAAAFAVASLHDHAAELAPILVARLADESDGVARASMLIALGLLGDEGPVAIITAVLGDESRLERGAAAIALAYTEKELRPEIASILVELARSDERSVAGLPWGYGDLSALAALVLEVFADAATLYDFVDDTPIPDQGSDPGRAIALTRAADRLLRLTVPTPLAPESPATALSDEQRHVVARLARHPRLWTARTATALGLPPSPEETRAWLGIADPPPPPTILDRVLNLDGKDLTMREWWTLASGEDEAPRQRLVAAVAINFTVKEAMELWMRAHCDIPGEEHGPMSPALQLRIIGAFNESAEPILLHTAAELEADGPPRARRRIAGYWATVQFTRLYGYVGAALARIAYDLGYAADDTAFALLDKAIAIMPELDEIREAIAAFPRERAAELVIKSTRCSYWSVAPSDEVTKAVHQALTRLPSREHAEPYVADYITALRKAGQEDEADTLQEHWDAFLAGTALELDDATQRIAPRGQR